MNEQAGVIGGLDHGAFEKLSFGRMKQRMRREYLIEARRYASLTCHHADRVGAGHRLQGTSGSGVCGIRDIVDDTCRRPAFGDRVIRLTGQ